MTLLQLEYFVKIIETGSFSRAAAELYISQPTISRAIASLEEEFGVQLFFREKSTSLTAAGELFFEKAMSIFCTLDELNETMRKCRAHVTGSLRISYHHFDTTIASILMNGLKGMAEKHPDVSVYIRNYTAVGNSLLGGRPECDIVFTLACDVMGQENITYREICSDPVMAVMPSAHPLAHKERLCMADLSDCRVLLPGMNLASINDDLIYIRFQNSGHKLENVKVVPRAEYLAPMVVMGDGIALVPMSIAKVYHMDSYDTLSCFPVRDCDAGLDIVAAWRAEDPNPAILLFLQELQT